MEVIILKDTRQVARYAADMVVRLLASKPQSVLGLATGATPIALYRELIERHLRGEVSFAGVSTFNLDEYLGLVSGSVQSYRHFMQEQLFNHLDIDMANTFLPECKTGHDPRSVGPVYEQLIAERGGIDLQILGIGRNGHIGFNEPSSSLGSRTRVKTLAQRTMDDNRRMFSDAKASPGMAITMGIATIMDARRVMLLATGEHKAQPIQAAVEGAISAMHPASALQHHQRVRVVVDEAAASKLELGEYYQWVQTLSEQVASPHGGLAISDPWVDS